MLTACSGNSQTAPTPSGIGTLSADRQLTVADRSITSVFGRETTSVLTSISSAESFFSADASGKPLIFASVQGSKGQVDIYQQSAQPKLVGSIGKLLPEGLATDAAGNLYIANGLGSSNTNVLVYAPPYTGAPALTLADPNGAPLGVAVSTTGLVAAANDNGTVNFYNKNSTTACVTVADAAHVAQVATATFDDKGVLYVVAYDPSFKPILAEIVGGCRAKAITLLTTVNTIGDPLDVQMAKGDRIAILDANAGIIYTYNPPKNNSFGSPVFQTKLTGASPFSFAFLTSGSDLYALKYSGVANEFAYPAGGAPKTIINIPTNKAPTGGVAVFPPFTP